ncbi:MAG: ccpA [Planctomycetaceae bacterium]|nr:ccpA [Planctomycetaceae bacterium]
MQPENHQSQYRRFLGPAVVVGLILLDILVSSRLQPIMSLAPGATRSKTVPVALAAAAVAKDDELLKEAQTLFKPLPQDLATAEFPINSDLVSLGRKLFFDPRISVDGTVSCARCHQPALYGTDGLEKSHGAHDKLLPRNAPTVLNAGMSFRQHWGGEFETVEEQAKRALLGAGFANPDYAAAMARVKAVPGYRELFKKAFPSEPDPVTANNWAKAIGAYERTLMTPSRFDVYLGGNTDALTPTEQHGLRTFINTGCADCHRGAGIGGEQFRKFGVQEDYWNATGSKEIDKGRFELTKDPADQYMFKVAGLRGVEMTPPYFHDGSVGTLSEAVRVMAIVQLGHEMSDQDASAIVAFLKSLTGKLPQDFAIAPVLPSGGFGMPRPVSRAKKLLKETSR